MEVIKTISELKAYLAAVYANNQIIGFVPTMGALHEGHISLINESKQRCDVTVCSIFINPQQFNNIDDFKNYPVTLEEDISKLINAQCDVLFLPSSSEIYHDSPKITFHFGELEQIMEGAFRPGHFSGVALVVSKLFNIVKPQMAFFGEKDYQQLAIINQLVKDLNIDVSVVSCPTLREKSGLAMSSRNKRLTSGQKIEAAKIYESLLMAKKILPITSIYETKETINTFYSKTNLKLEYFEIVDSITLQPIKKYTLQIKITICVAAYLGNVRLIDNISL